MKRLAILLVVLFPFFIAIQSFGESLPEFYGCYLKKQDSSYIELEKNKNIGSTGWFVKKPKTKSSDLQSLQKQLSSGGDLMAAFRAGTDTKPFISGFSDIDVTTKDLSGLIIYGEFNIDQVKIYKLSNQVIPSDATFVEYHGPRPIDKNNMWFPAISYDFRSKPIKDKMYYIKTREQLTCGCYVVKMGKNLYDFTITSESTDPLIGKWVRTRYLEKKGLFGKTVVNQITEMNWESIDSDGFVKGSWILKSPKGEVLAKGKFREDEVKVDRKANLYIQTGIDEGKEGHIYGYYEGKITVTGSGKCNCGQAIIEGDWIPYDKYKDDKFLKKYKLFFKSEKL